MTDDRFTWYDRREVLALGATGIATLAGCGGPSGGSPTDAGGSPTGTSTSTGTYMNGVGPDASVSFAVPMDGAGLTSTSVQWDTTAEGVTIEEAGEVTEGAGHYHVMFDTGPVTPGEIIPSDDAHIHYGTGQTEGVFALEPGEHTLHLQVADGAHRAMGLTDTVEVTVEDTASLDLSTSVDGSVVEWTIEADNYTIEPSSNGINSDAGHLHAIIDAELVPLGDVIPSDARHVHYGDGSTSGTIDLAEQLGDEYDPGEHTIRFQVGTGTHRAVMVHVQTTVTTS
ncbi:MULTISPECIES: DUF4399 domain-containing protein [Salinibaculum]|uniref:DUF4399 domain-containing protein n=1 Tax=Salinibaculum TaxID=2732368 RepID=UPI0030CFBB9E